MPRTDVIEHALMRLTDALVDLLPSPRPTAQMMERCKIIAHRGEHRPPGVVENTLPAFDLAEAAGVWGIELDLQWTSDGTPVVLHDPDLTRLFGIHRNVSEMSRHRLYQTCPSIPSLAEIVRRYGRKMHLMIEIKSMPANCSSTLHHILAPLNPVHDYHLLSLNPASLPPMPEFEPSTFVAVAGNLPHRLSRWALRHRWGGICAHYLLLGDAMVRQHHAAGQAVGIGYARSQNSLFRELNRGVDWIFSNHATDLQQFLSQAMPDQSGR